MFDNLFFLLSLLLLFRSPVAEDVNDGLKLVIDHDGGADDAIAITLSLLYEKYFNGPKVVALTTVHGNVNQSQATVNSARILDLSGRSDIPIYAGARRSLITSIQKDFFFGYDGLGDLGYVHSGPVTVQNMYAAVGLIELSKKYEGNLIVLAIGPLTNIALAIRLDPDFIDRLAQLYVGAGHINSHEFPDPEFNAEMDSEAYYIVADSAKVDKVTFSPFSQVYTWFSIDKEWRMNVFGAIDTPIVQALNGFERISLANAYAWVLLDPAVTAIMLEPSIVTEFKNSSNGIILCEPGRSINTNDFTSYEPNVRIFYSGDVERYKNFLIDVYSAELKN